jgi:hypothetical protein
MNNVPPKKTVYPATIFFATIIALTALFNSNIEMSLKIAFTAALFIFRILKDDSDHQSTLMTNTILALNSVYFKYILNKINIRQDKSNDEEAVNVDSILDSLHVEFREHISLQNEPHRASGTAMEFFVCLGVSMAIVKYALPLL